MNVFGKSLLSGMLLAGVSMPALSAEIIVDKDGGGNFTTLAEAVNTAFANDEADTITVMPGNFIVDGFFGETLTFQGDDDITIVGSDPDDRPVIPVEPNFDVGGDFLDGVVIEMTGQLTFENIVFVPTEAFALEDGVDDLIAINNVGNEDSPAELDLTFRNVVITHSTLDGAEPVTLTGFDDPRNALNTFRDDAINVFTDAEAPALPDQLNLLLDNVVISGYGTDTGSDAFVLDGPNIDATITNGSKFTFIRRRGIFVFNANSLTITGSDENPNIVYAAGETMARASAGTHNWSHLWCIGVQEGDGDQTINTGWALRIDPDGGANLSMENCIFTTAINDGGFMNFGSDTAIDYEFTNCTFHNVPQLLRMGFASEPGPGENISVTVTDTIVDNADWTAPADGSFFAPEPTVIDYGAGDETLANVTLNNLGYRTETLVSSRSGSRMPETSGVVEVDTFEFVTEEFDPNDFSDFLKVSNCDLLGSAGSNGSPLGGARPTTCPTDVEGWSVF